MKAKMRRRFGERERERDCSCEEEEERKLEGVYKRGDKDLEES